MKRYYADVVIVGTGGAGILAAIEASKKTHSVAVISKGKVGRSGATIMAPGGVAAVNDLWKEANDSKELHEKEAYIGGDWLNNQELMGQIAEEIGEVLISLEKMGALFERQPDGNKPRLKTDGGHSHNRSLFVEDRIGREMMRALAAEVTKRSIPVYEEVMVTNLLRRENKIVGAIGYDINTLEPALFECKRLIVATGGAGMVYSNTSNPIDLTGDGFLLCAEVGAQLIDMEFVQFFPIGMLFPESYKGILCGTAMYSRLYNSREERFMERYDPERMEGSTRDYISRAIMQEVLDGKGSPRGGVYCDCSHNNPGFFKNFLNYAYKLHMSAGIDMDKDRFETAPSSHFIMGGVRVDRNWSTGIEGLYCIGEAAGGAHGSNRISQNALSDILVSGVVAARHAVQELDKTDREYVSPAVLNKLDEEIDALFKSKNGLKPAELRSKIRATMWENAGVIRSDESLRKALKQIMELEKEPVSINNRDKWVNQEVTQAFENKSLLVTAKAVIMSALERTETRGAHYRSDYPKTDETWLKNVILTGNGNTFEVSTQDVSFTRIRKGELK